LSEEEASTQVVVGKLAVPSTRWHCEPETRLEEMMAHRIPVAPAALRPYIPGALAQVYHSLNPAARAKIAAETDKLFVAKTGVRRKLDERNRADRVLVRQWLLIRDAVIAIYRYEEIARQTQRRNAQAEVEAELARLNLPEALDKGGLPEEVSGELLVKVLNGAHLTIEAVHWLHIFEDVWPHVVGEGLEAVAPMAMILGYPLAVLAGLLEIGEAHEAGDREAERHAFMHGFASHLVHGYIINRLGVNSVLGQKQILGEKAAMRFLRELPADVRAKFLRRYRGRQRYGGENMNKALSDLGYGR
jgi:hypothetical protein